MSYNTHVENTRSNLGRLNNASCFYRTQVWQNDSVLGGLRRSLCRWTERAYGANAPRDRCLERTSTPRSSGHLWSSFG